MDRKLVTNWLQHLSQSDLVLLKNFIIQSGNIKSLSAHYSVSYPTMRARLDSLIEKITIGDKEPDPFIAQLQTYAIDRKIPSQFVQDIAEIYYTREESK